MDLSGVLINDLTPREEKIVYMAVERALRMIPEVVGQLLLQKETTRKLAKNFYKNNPEFLNHKDIVTAEIERYEGENPGVSYGEILKAVTPTIKAKIETIASLDLTTPEKPTDLTFRGEAKTSDHGEI
jgi:hypothetical protein